MQERSEKPLSIKNIFTQHPHSIGETYFQHLRYASAHGLRLTLSGMACIIHSIFPFLFVNTASNTVQEVYKHIMKRKNMS